MVSEDDSLKLRPGANLVTGEHEFRQVFGAPTSLETDVLTVASAIFAADLAFKRGERTEYHRQIHLTIPVINRPVFRGVAEDLRTALMLVSSDAWTLDFIQRDGVAETSRMWLQQGPGKVLLFSGGLDSMAAAVMYGEAKERIYLSSHVTANPAVRGAQNATSKYLDSRFPGQFSRLPFRVSGTDKSADGFPFPREREQSQRTRSVLFLALAALVARRQGIEDVVVIAENGQLAIHVPITAARPGAFSTRTAHPEFVSKMAEVLTSVLEYRIRIENPFLYKTKAEVIETPVRRHRSVVEGTVSCWKASRVGGDKTHCGYCVPCLSRRIALETHGLRLPEYQVDMFTQRLSTLPPQDEGKRNLVELIEFVLAFGGGSTQTELEDEYPDLWNDEFDRVAAIDMYRRFAGEALEVFDRYPTVKAIAG